MKIIYNIATIPDRKEQLLQTINSVINQCDEINIMLNLYKAVPVELLNNPKIKTYLCDNSIADGYKFLHATKYKDAILFFIDDDLIYPDNYTEYMMQKLQQYEYKVAITLHGRTFAQYPIDSYYRDKTVTVYHCLKSVINDTTIDFIGAGVMCCHSNLFKNFNLSIFNDKPFMGDIIMSTYFVQNNIPLICIAHEQNYLQYQKVPNTIYDTYCTNDIIQTTLANQLYEPIISFIVAAYNTADFLEECLDSIANQKCRKEIIIGVDGCEKTLIKLKEIINKYDNLRAYYFHENHGMYIILNSLIKMAKGNYISIFGADDIMLEDYSNIILKEIKNCDILLSCGNNFYHPDKTHLRQSKLMHGVQFYKKEIIEKLGGYANWRCAADTDLLTRAENMHLSIKSTSKSIFLRRIHINNITMSEEYSMISPYRISCVNLITQRKVENFQVENFTIASDYINILKSNFNDNPEYSC